MDHKDGNLEITGRYTFYNQEVMQLLWDGGHILSLIVPPPPTSPPSPVPTQSLALRRSSTNT